MMMTVEEMPLERLKERAARAGRSLREARRRATTAEGLRAIDIALDEAERLLPGIMDAGHTSAMRAVRALTPEEQGALEGLLRDQQPQALCEPLSPARRMRAPRGPLGEVGYTSAELLDALERARIQDALTSDLMSVLRVLESDSRCGGPRAPAP